MELATESDIYTPSINDKGDYVDNIPSFANLKNGIRCPCGTRKDKTYNTRVLFLSHLKSECHKNWLKNLTLNKTNYYVENQTLKETLLNQRLIISKLEIEVHNKMIIIEYLKKEMENKNKNNIVVTDLIDF